MLFTPEILLVIVIVVVLVIQAIIGIYVYRDSKNWDKNTPVQTDPAEAAEGYGSSPKTKKVKRGWIFLTFVLLPALLIVMSIIGYAAISSSGCSSSVTTLSVAEYLEENDSPEIQQWLKNRDADSDKAYVLHSERKKGDTVTTEYLVYLSWLKEDTKAYFSSNTGVLGRTFQIDIAGRTQGSGNTLLAVTCVSDKAQDLKINCEGEAVDCEMTDVDVPLGIEE